MFGVCLGVGLGLFGLFVWLCLNVFARLFAFVLLVVFSFVCGVMLFCVVLVCCLSNL